MRKTALLLIAVAALTGCENKKEMTRLQAEAASAKQDAQLAQADKAKLQTEKDALAAEVAAMKKTAEAAEAAKTAKAAAEEALAKAKETNEALSATMNGLKLELEKAKAAAADAKAAQAAAETAKVVLQKEKDEAVAATAKAKAGSPDATRQIEELKTREKALAEKVSAKEAEAAQARGTLAAVEKRAQEAQAKADQASSALRERLTSAGKGVLAPNLTLPVTFTARKGEKIKWAWTLAETPPDLAVEALEFVVMGPSEAKAYGVRAGVENKGDHGVLEATDDGRWTLFWMNRHPSAPLTIDYTVSLDPAGTAAPRKSGG